MAFSDDVSSFFTGLQEQLKQIPSWVWIAGAGAVFMIYSFSESGKEVHRKARHTAKQVAVWGAKESGRLGVMAAEQLIRERVGKPPHPKGSRMPAGGASGTTVDGEWRPVSTPTAVSTEVRRAGFQTGPEYRSKTAGGGPNITPEDSKPLSTHNPRKRSAGLPAKTSIYADGGKTVDRYTLITADRSMYGFDEDPFYPLGFGQYVGDWEGGSTRHLGKLIPLSALPVKAQQFVKERV